MSLASAAPGNERLLPFPLWPAITLWIVVGARAAQTSEIPTISVADVSIFEGSSGTRTLTFVITRSTPQSRSSVRYDVTNVTALAESDFVAAQSSGVLFSDGETAKNVDVTVNGDMTGEPDETLRITLSSPTGATIEDALGQATIINDHLHDVHVAHFDPSTVDGNSGTTIMQFTVITDGSARRPSVTTTPRSTSATRRSERVVRTRPAHSHSRSNAKEQPTARRRSLTRPATRPHSPAQTSSESPRRFFLRAREPRRSRSASWATMSPSPMRRSL